MATDVMTENGRPVERDVAMFIELTPEISQKVGVGGFADGDKVMLHVRGIISGRGDDDAVTVRVTKMAAMPDDDMDYEEGFQAGLSK